MDTLDQINQLHRFEEVPHEVSALVPSPVSKAPSLLAWMGGDASELRL